jgi:RNA polymerase sigma-70 factor (ECF subfamily)
MAERAEDEFALMGRRYRPALMAFFLRRIGNLVEAEDLTQEALARLIEHRADDVGNREAYIFRIAANLVRDRHRRFQVRESWQSDASHQDLHTDFVDPLRLLEGRESLVRVATAIGELSQRSREILLLFRLERMRKRDIADSFGISLSAVDKHLIRATAHLTKRLEEDA